MQLVRPWGRPKAKLPSSWSRIGRRLTSNEATRAVESAEAEAPQQLGLYRLKANKQQDHEGCGVGRSLDC